MFGSNLQYNLSVEGPWKQFQDRDVHNLNEAARLVYDVDTQIISRESAFMVFEHRLRGLNDMPATLEECGRMLQETTKGVVRTDKWKAVAKKLRLNMKQDGEERLKVAREAFFNEEANFRNEYPANIEPEDDDGRALKRDRKTRLDFLRQNLEAVKKDSLLIESQTEGEYNENEERTARAITGEQMDAKADDMNASKIDVSIWHRVLKKILKTILIAEDDQETEAKWGDVCKNRLENCVVNKQLLPFAEEGCMLIHGK